MGCQLIVTRAFVMINAYNFLLSEDYLILDGKEFSKHNYKIRKRPLQAALNVFTTE
jgi:hypothetical protein